MSIQSEADEEEFQIDLEDAVKELKQMFPQTQDDIILSTLMKSGKKKILFLQFPSKKFFQKKISFFLNSQKYFQEMSIDDTIQKLLKRSRLEEKKMALKAGEDVDDISEISSKVYSDEDGENEYVNKIRREFFGDDIEKIDKLRKKTQAKKLMEKSPKDVKREARLEYLCNLPASEYIFPFMEQYDSHSLMPPEYFQFTITGHSVISFHDFSFKKYF